MLQWKWVLLGWWIFPVSECLSLNQTVIVREGAILVSPSFTQTSMTLPPLTWNGLFSHWILMKQWNICHLWELLGLDLNQPRFRQHGKDQNIPYGDSLDSMSPHPFVEGAGRFRLCFHNTTTTTNTKKKSKKGPHQKINLSKWSLLFFPALTFNQESETSTTVDGTTPEAQDTRSEDAIPQTPRFAIPWSKWIDLHDWRLHSHRVQVEWLRERLDDSNFWVKSGSVSLRNIETAAFVSFCLQSVQSQFSPGFHSMDQRGKISVQHVVFSLLKGHGGRGKKPSRNLLNCSHQVRDGVGDPASQILSINW